MRVYVLGAGVSKTVGYPLASELFQEVNNHVRTHRPLWNHFDYKGDWSKLLRWLRENRNSLIAEAYRTRHIEHLFTILDLAALLRSDSLDAIWFARKKGLKAVARAESVYQRFARVTDSYRKYRQILLWALESYLEHKHYKDCTSSTGSEWKYLRAFGQKLRSEDVVITFNYDSSLERVLLQQGKWSPKDGYGFEAVFQRSDFDSRVVPFPPSIVHVLHLHGAVGWYKKPSLREDFPLRGVGGAIPREALTPAPRHTPIALAPIFLKDLRIQAVDASLPRQPPQDTQILLHPSFFKDYELEGGSTVFTELWRKAASALKVADEVVIIGYSLPKADSASLTLLLTNCDRSKVRIVNSNKSANRRLRQLLSTDTLGAAQSFQDWLEQTPNCSNKT